MNPSVVRLGIVGAGHIGSVHCRHAARLPNATVAVIADSHHGKSELLAASVGALATDSVDTLLGENVDAVIVAVPTPLHRTVVEACLRAGKAVLCEKPLALTLEDCDAMLAVAAESGALLTVGQVVRFFPEFARAKSLIESGAVGQPAAVRTRRAGRFPLPEWFKHPEKSGGILFDLLVHDFDWLQWCFGPIIRVHARTLTERALPGIDYALVTLRHASGVIAHVEGFWGDPAGFQTTFEIAGDSGMLTHDSRKSATLIRTQQGAGTASSSAGPLYPDEDPFYRQLTAFVTAVQTGVPAVPGHDGRQAVAVALAARTSSRTGQAEAVAPV